MFLLFSLLILWTLLKLWALRSNRVSANFYNSVFAASQRVLTPIWILVCIFHFADFRAGVLNYVVAAFGLALISFYLTQRFPLSSEGSYWLRRCIIMVYNELSLQLVCVSFYMGVASVFFALSQLALENVHYSYVELSFVYAVASVITMNVLTYVFD